MCDLNEMADILASTRDASDMVDRADGPIALERMTGIAAARASMHGLGQDDCEECGMDIPKDRREAAPWAIRCAPCQGVYEEKGKHRYG